MRALAGEHPQRRRGLAHHPVAAQHVAAAQPVRAYLRAARRAEVCRVGVDGARPPAPAGSGPGGAQAQRQVEVLVVEEDPLVEAADRLEGGPRVERRAAGRPERVGRAPRRLATARRADSRSPSGSRSAITPAESIRRGVALLQQHPGDHLGAAARGPPAAPRRTAARRPTSLLRTTIGSPASSATARLTAGPKPTFSPISRTDLRELARTSSDRAVGRAVVDDDDRRRPPLASEALEERAQAVPALQVRYVDGRFASQGDEAG